jgi:hypothetical protein
VVWFDVLGVERVGAESVVAVVVEDERRKEHKINR